MGQRPELLVRLHRDGHPLLLTLAPEHVVRRLATVPVARLLRFPAGQRVLHHRLGDHPRQGLGHGHLDELALPGARAVVQRLKHGQHAVAAGEGVRDQTTHDSGVSAGVPGYRCQPAEQVDDTVKARQVLERPAPAEGAQRHVDDVRAQLLHLIVAQPQALHHSGRVVLHQHVADPYDVPGNFQCVGIAQIEGTAQLVIVDQVESAALVDTEFPVGKRRPHPCGEPRLRLYQDHLRAKPAQHLGGDRRGDHLSEVRHTYPTQRRRVHGLRPPGKVPSPSGGGLGWGWLTPASSGQPSHSCSTSAVC